MDADLPAGKGGDQEECRACREGELRKDKVIWDPRDSVLVRTSDGPEGPGPGRSVLASAEGLVGCK